ncbi:MAG: ABC transporter ATP-binding protein/permease [Firmicutes bacterium]|nr:ABC transporter ATP-binding protein/permease [Bacillota bacterium]
MNKSINAFFRVFGFMKPVQGKYFAGSALASLELVMLFSIPVVNRLLVEMIMNTGTNNGMGTVWHITLIMAGLMMLTPLVAIGRYWQGLCSQKTADNIGKALFAHIQRLPVSSISKRQTGDYLMRVTNDAARAGNMFQGFAVVSLLRFLVVTTVAMVILFVADWRIAILALVYNLVCFVLSLLLNPYVNKLERDARQEIAASSNVVLETMRSLPIVRVFMLGHVLAEKYRRRCDRIMQKRAKFRAVNGITYGVVDFFSFSSQAVGFIAAIFLLSRGQMDLGEAVFTASVMALASDAMLRLSTFILLIQPPLVAADRVFEILDEPAEDVALPVAGNEAVVSLKNVTFAYESGKKVLDGINLTIKPGEKIAIVGSSGSGKTTLAQVIATLYKPMEGEINYYHRGGTLTARDLIAYVPQEPVLFDGTIYENIAYGKPGASAEEIQKAALDAGLEELPLDTDVGERGSQLSGGQRQRVAIARAMLKNAPLLILDEATSALDSDTEAQVQKSLDLLMEGRASITIAHRLSTIQNADRVLEMEDGRISLTTV